MEEREILGDKDFSAERPSTLLQFRRLNTPTRLLGAREKRECVPIRKAPAGETVKSLQRSAEAVARLSEKAEKTGYLPDRETSVAMKADDGTCGGNRLIRGRQLTD